MVTLNDYINGNSISQCLQTVAIESDGIDNDCDGKVDEEIRDRVDNDGDGLIDEDIHLVGRGTFKY